LGKVLVCSLWNHVLSQSRQRYKVDNNCSRFKFRINNSFYSSNNMKTYLSILALLAATAPALAQSAPGSILTDADGEHMIATTGERIPVLRQSGVSTVPIPAARFMRRQAQTPNDTFTPPASCIDDKLACTALAGSGSLKAICIDCVTGFGNGAQVSPSVDCRNSGSSCPVTTSKTVTNTDTISIDISFGANIGDTGSDGVAGSATFGLSTSFSTAIAKGQTLGLSVPQGKIGFLQYQPPAVLGTVVTSQVAANHCNGVAQNNVCGAAPGILATSKDDSLGQYSIVLTG
jgi:hypothetical protein